jgi:hypothetical protein
VVRGREKGRKGEREKERKREGRRETVFSHSVQIKGHLLGTQL